MHSVVTQPHGARAMLPGMTPLPKYEPQPQPPALQLAAAPGPNTPLPQHQPWPGAAGSAGPLPTAPLPPPLPSSPPPPAPQPTAGQTPCQVAPAFARLAFAPLEQTAVQEAKAAVGPEGLPPSAQVLV